MGLTWREVVDRFWNLKPAKGGGICIYHLRKHYRDEVEVEDGIVYYYLHRVCIARYYPDANILELDHNGYDTPTTRDRLNAIARFGRVSLTTKGLMFFPRKSSFAYDLPVVIDLENGKVLNFRKEYSLVPKIGKVEGMNYTTVRMNGDTFVVRESGKVFRVLKEKVNGKRVKYYKHYGEYICERVDGLPT